MKLTVLGCSGSFPGPDSMCSSYLVEHDDGERTWRLLLDLGTGTLGALQRTVDPLDIDALFLSHLHADHCLDMCGYYVLRKYHPTGAAAQLPVWGPVGTADRVARAYDLPLDPGMKQEFDFRLYTGPISLGPFKVTAYSVYHPVPAYALRIEAGGRVLAYSGDTDVCDNLVEAAKDADLLLAEASFLTGLPNPPGVHMTGAECGEVAVRANAARLMLTHVPPWFSREEMLDDARGSDYAGPIEVAVPDAVIEV